MTVSPRLPALNLPPVDVQLRERAGREELFDPVRRQWVRATPEEWVRRHLLGFLIDERGAPAGLVAVEKAFQLHGETRRGDIVVHDRRGRPLVVVECKAPDVPLRQLAFDQIAAYNLALGAPYLVISNGLEHYCLRVDLAAGSYAFLDDLPPYEALLTD